MLHDKDDYFLEECFFIMKDNGWCMVGCDCLGTNLANTNRIENP